MASILIVEDEAIVAMSIEAAVETAGYKVQACVPTFARALAAIEQEEPDAALLDVRLRNDEAVYPVAAELAKRGVPFALMTGYSAETIDPAYSGCMVLH